MVEITPQACRVVQTARQKNSSPAFKPTPYPTVRGFAVQWTKELPKSAARFFFDAVFSAVIGEGVYYFYVEEFCISEIILFFLEDLFLDLPTKDGFWRPYSQQ